MNDSYSVHRHTRHHGNARHGNEFSQVVQKNFHYDRQSVSTDKECSHCFGRSIYYWFPHFSLFLSIESPIRFCIILINIRLALLNIFLILGKVLHISRGVLLPLLISLQPQDLSCFIGVGVYSYSYNRSVSTKDFTPNVCTKIWDVEIFRASTYRLASTK